MKKMIYLEDAIQAIKDLPDCPNGYSGTYDKACIIGVLEDVPSAIPEGFDPEHLTEQDRSDITAALDFLKAQLEKE